MVFHPYDQFFPWMCTRVEDEPKIHQLCRVVYTTATQHANCHFHESVGLREMLTCRWMLIRRQSMIMVGPYMYHLRLHSGTMHVPWERLSDSNYGLRRRLRSFDLVHAKSFDSKSAKCVSSWIILAWRERKLGHWMKPIKIRSGHAGWIVIQILFFLRRGIADFSLIPK